MKHPSNRYQRRLIKDKYEKPKGAKAREVWRKLKKERLQQQETKNELRNPYPSNR